MARLNWSDTSSRLFEVGLDRGVLYPKNGQAVPWYGLTNVSEAGAEESKAYYMDGRPYLIVPQPKEYEATLKAYTYPDEFSELMGLKEATDGLFVDSQQSDSFNLSYRTLIGDAAQGTDVGYKIHIVYNAVVSPDSQDYSTLSGSIDPSEFSWSIKAWPMPIAGHRPSAHFVIDTRHIDANKLAEIEGFLYGTDEIDAQTPDPNSIVDILSYNGLLTVIDNGDGTWSVNGPSEMISVDADGNFVLSNVVATMLPNGVYIFEEDYVPPPVIDIDGGSPTSTDSDDIDGGGASGIGDSDYDGGTA